MSASSSGKGRMSVQRTAPKIARAAYTRPVKLGRGRPSCTLPADVRRLVACAAALQAGAQEPGEPGGEVPEGAELAREPGQGDLRRTLADAGEHRVRHLVGAAHRLGEGDVRNPLQLLAEEAGVDRSGRDDRAGDAARD